MRVLLLTTAVALLWCGSAEARYQWLESNGLPCETVCRHPIMINDNPIAYVCGGHVVGAPPADIRAGMIGAGGTHCYLPGEAPRLRTTGAFLCLCQPR